jgi:hypothetical protein
MNLFIAVVFIIASLSGAIWIDQFFRHLVPWEKRPSKLAVVSTRLILIIFVIEGLVHLLKLAL